MLDKTTKRKIDNARDILVGKVPIPKSQIDLITITLIYKFMDDMDRQAEEIGGNASFFVQDFEKYAWAKVMDQSLGGYERLQLFDEGLIKMNQNPHIPALFREIFKNAFLPFRDPETLNMFLEEINDFDYGHSEKLGDAFEYLLSIMSSQGDAGQFRTPRHIIEFIVDVVNPTKTDKILDPACGTAGFLISAYKHIMEENTEDYYGDMLNSDERDTLANNIVGYDISPDMVRLSLVNMFLHKFPNPQIFEYDTLTNTERWEDSFSCILANPPFMSPKGGIKPHSRYAIKSKRSEVLFVDYMMEHLTEDGKAGIIVPEGIIFQSQKAHKELRKKMVEQNYLWAVVSLPSGIFQPYSGVKTSILLFDKARAKASDKIVFAKVQNDGYSLGSQRTPINKNDLPKLIDALNYYKNKNEICENQCESVAKEDCISHGLTQIETDKENIFKNISIVEKSKLAENDYNLSGDRYIVESIMNHSNWEMVYLGDVCELVRGVTYTKSDEVDENGHMILRANNISLESNTLNLDDIKMVKLDKQPKLHKKLSKDDILICLASGSKKHIGKVAYSDSETEYYFGGFMGVVRCTTFKNIPKFIYHLLKHSKFNEFINSQISGANIHNLNSKILYKYLVPLPPLEVQEEIVAEIEGYQKIIDGAKQVVDNYKPHIDIDPEWDVVEFEDVCTLEYGKSLPKSKRIEGEFPVVGSNGITGYHNEFLLEAPSIIVGRKGSAGEVVFISKPCYPIDTTYYVELKSEDTKLKYVYYILKSMNLVKLKGGAGIPGLNRNDVYRTIKIPKPSLEIQQRIVSKIDEEQKYVDGCKKLIEIYEQKIKERIDKVWEG